MPATPTRAPQTPTRHRRVRLSGSSARRLWFAAQTDALHRGLAANARQRRFDDAWSQVYHRPQLERRQ